MGGSSTISNSEDKIAGVKLQTSSYGVAIPVVYGTNRISGNLLWYGNFQAIPHTTTQSSGGKGGSVNSESTTYTYTAAVMMALAEGQIAGIGAVWKGKDKTDAATLGLTLFTGAQGQAAWGWLTTYNGLSTTPAWEGAFGYLHQAAPYAQYALGYSGTAYVAASAYELDSSAAVPNHGFEVQGLNIYGGGIVDANPSDVLSDFLTNSEYGAGFNPALMGDLSVYSAYCRAYGIFISPAIDQQKKAADWLNDFMSATNTALVWSEGKLKAIPYGDTAATGNGATFTPNTTPLYDLTDDDFIDNKNSDPVTVERSTPADAYNRVQIEYLDRANQYNIEIVEAKDQFSIETYGLRSMQPVSMHFICDGQIAKLVAQIILQRALYVRNSYRFQLDWRYSVLEPMDLVTLTDAALGLNALPVRIIEIAEDADGLLSVKAEDFPLGAASATRYPHDSGQRYQVNLNTVPQNVVTPQFFEAPTSLTTTGLQVWAATGGQPSDSIYGGCRVWVSLDGMTYKAMGVINGSARFGVTSALLPAHATGADSTSILSLSLSAKGQLLSGSTADVNSGTTLTAVGQEYLAYQTATLTGTNAYNLTTLNRGLYSTNSAGGPHALGSAWARIDAAIARSDDLDMSMIGKTIYFKFTAFNVYGGGEQSLASVAQYTYTVTGYMTALPPSGVASLSASVDAALTVTLAWPAVSDLDIGGYELRDGATWSTATLLGQVKGTTYKLGLVSGSHTYQVKAVDVNGNYSAAAATTSITVSTTSAVTSLTVSAVTISGSAGTQSPAFNISWTAANSAILQSTAIEYKKSADTNWIAYANVTPPNTTAQIVGIEPATNYDVRVAELYNNGVKSAYATAGAVTSSASQTVGAAAAAPWSGVSSKPANVAALTGSEGIQNSLVSISPTGLLSGAGGGQVTVQPVVDGGTGTGAGQRQTDDPPVYYPVGLSLQFKDVASFPGIATAAGPSTGFMTLETNKKWADTSGGMIVQYAHCDNGKTFKRYGVTNAANWTGYSWFADLDRNNYTGDLNATNGAPSGTNIGSTAATDIETRVTTGLTAGTGVVATGKAITDSIITNGVNTISSFSDTTGYSAGATTPKVILSFALVKDVASSGVKFELEAQVIVNTIDTYTAGIFILDLQQNISGTWTSMPGGSMIYGIQGHTISYFLNRYITGIAAGSTSWRVVLTGLGGGFSASISSTVVTKAEVKR